MTQWWKGSKGEEESLKDRMGGRVCCAAGDWRSLTGDHQE